MKKLLGSFISVVVGWTAGVIWFSAWLAIVLFSSTYPNVKDSLLWLGVCAGFMWLFIIPSWLFVLVPFYFFVPRDSLWWKWPTGTFLGAMAGCLIMMGYTIFRQWDVLAAPLTVLIGGPFEILPAALIGGVSFLTASLTANRFNLRRDI